MKRHYFTLQIIYELARLAKNPTSHSCHPSDIILRHNLPWDIVAEHLHLLKKEGLILMEHKTTTTIKITDSGLNRFLS